MSKTPFSIRCKRLTETKALKSYVPSLYNDRAVDGSWRELNWRLNGPGLEKLCCESKRNHQTEQTRGEQNENRSNGTVSRAHLRVRDARVSGEEQE
jgi:hypothetical protein